ncbi:putative DNA-binding domain-containing protein [Aeromonas veronii]|uniref:HvfC/BufC family peptide modification chaperone n=1 Tax=Aeromonas veronii TaxID=654 RepID=UPI001F33D456|nr:putative DNA-binding domain-containing protein [Aeromonas veronii]MCF5892123.1 putative DNA-binding domain-containing protein [Aeromonas veronii]
MDRRLSLITSPKTAPQRMQQQTAWLASRVRLPQDGIASHYARSVRANVESVLESAFPLTHAHWAPVDRWQLVEGFVIQYGAEAPEFHHIATEFVRYVQHRHSEGSLNWPRQRLALLEYEWACLCVEIDEGVVVPGEEVTAESPLWLNPTLQLLELPFVIRRSGVVPTRQGNHFYGLFRSPDHRVVTQRLREWDVALIQLLQQQPGITQAAFQQQVQQVRSDFDLSEWARHFHRLGLLTLSVGERQPGAPLPPFSKHQGEFP